MLDPPGAIDRRAPRKGEQPAVNLVDAGLQPDPDLGPRQRGQGLSRALARPGHRLGVANGLGGHPRLGRDRDHLDGFLFKDLRCGLADCR